MGKTLHPCPECGTMKDTGHIKEHLRSCRKELTECGLCGETFVRARAHRRKCKGHRIVTPPALLPLLRLDAHGWHTKCPSCFTSLVPLQDVDQQTADLWHRLPRLSPAPSIIPQLRIYQAVLDTIRLSAVSLSAFNVFEDGEERYSVADVGSKVPKEVLKKRFAMATTALYQATTGDMGPVDTPICSVLNVWPSDIAMEVPQYFQTSHTLCADTSSIGVNITPQGSFVDLHQDLGRTGFSVTYGKCEKIWLLFPPTATNLAKFAQSAGLPNRFARVGADLEGGIIVRMMPNTIIELPAGALHAVFTTVGGFLGGINVSTAEELPIMAQAIQSQLGLFRHAIGYVRDDVKIYLGALYDALDTDLPEQLLAPALDSWFTLSQEIHAASAIPSLRIDKEVTKALHKLLSRYETRECSCQAQFPDFGSDHLVADHLRDASWPW